MTTEHLCIWPPLRGILIAQSSFSNQQKFFLSLQIGSVNLYISYNSNKLYLHWIGYDIFRSTSDGIIRRWMSLVQTDTKKSQTWYRRLSDIGKKMKLEMRGRLPIKNMAPLTMLPALQQKPHRTIFVTIFSLIFAKDI